LRRAGITPAARAEIKTAFQIIYEQGRSLPFAIEALESEPRCPEVQHLIRFLKDTKRGICNWRRSAAR
jgi:UDP-N-acetylglucosamine acyltransferase